MIYIKLNIKKIFIITGFIFQLIGYHQLSWGTMHPNFEKSTCYNITNDNWSYHKENKNFYYKNSNNLYHIDHLKKITVAHPYQKKYTSPIFYKFKINLQNDSINVSHMFYEYLNKYRQMLPFVQLGLQNILSKKVISIGGGNKYIYNNQCAVGYNIFCHFPMYKKIINQPYLININGEYWFHNMIFMLNNFYKIDNLVYSKKPIKNNIQYPKYGYQMCVQIQPIKNYSELIGKITLEHFYYKNKMYHNLENNNINKNINLILSANYYPIPILGFNINKNFSKTNNQNTTCEILINYQFNVPIIQQMHHTKNNKINSSIFAHINDTIKPFIPMIVNTNEHHKENNSFEETKILKCCYQEIVGSPGEIKVIDITRNNNENKDQEDISIQWNTQSLQALQSYEGNIVLLKDNTYAIHMPLQLVTRDKNLIISYTIVTNNAKKNKCSYSNKQILILVHNFKNQALLNSKKLYTDNDHSNILSNHNDHFENNITNDYQQIHTSASNENCYYPNLNNDIHSTASSIQNPNIHNNASTKNNEEKIYHSPPPASLSYNYSNNDLPSQYPTPINSLSEENIVAVTDINDEAMLLMVETSSYLYKTPPTPPPIPITPPLSSTNNSSMQILSPSLLQQQIQQHKFNNNNSNAMIESLNNNDNNEASCHDNNPSCSSLLSSSSIQNQDSNETTSYSIGDNTHNTEDYIPCLNQNLLHLLSIHKKLKFSLIGTEEHINKLENTTKNRKKQNLSEMAKIFNKLHLTQSASSIDESNATEDSNDNNYLSRSSSSISIESNIME